MSGTGAVQGQEAAQAQAQAQAQAPAIAVRGLRKSYGGVEAVRGVDFEVASGSIFALLGPNGAGKTTTVEILEGFRHRDGGEVSVLGLDPAQSPERLRSHIGIVLQSVGVDRYLTVAETIGMFAGYYPHPRPVDEVVALVGLDAKRDTRVLKLSGGQQRRLDMAIALAGDPDLLFLDEPTTGFDPSARREAWEIVRNLADLGKTVLLTTHYMDEAQYLADEVAVIAAGRIVARGAPASIGGRDVASVAVRFGVPPGVEVPPDYAIKPLGAGRVEWQPDDLLGGLHRLTGWALAHGVTLDGLEIVRPTLEDVYLQLTGAPPEEPAPQAQAPKGRARRAR